mmetsp:Transcript_12052/g.29438  ORF Transcript_12052/g.29438 Transcript_12052/m.29438 type:complete len:351 (-) Transcript_12052:104-1156(-)
MLPRLARHERLDRDVIVIGVHHGIPECVHLGILQRRVVEAAATPGVGAAHVFVAVVPVLLHGIQYALYRDPRLLLADVGGGKLRPRPAERNVAVHHHHHPIDAIQKVRRVRHEQNGGARQEVVATAAVLAPPSEQPIEDPARRAGVQRAQRIVEQRDCRPRVHRPRQRHPLLLPPRQRHAALAYLGHVPRGEEIDVRAEAARVQDPAVPYGIVRVPEQYVIAQGRIQYECHLARVRDVAAHLHRRPGRDGDFSDDGIYYRALPAAHGSDHGQYLAGTDRYVRSPDREAVVVRPRGHVLPRSGGTAVVAVVVGGIVPGVERSVFYDEQRIVVVDGCCFGQRWQHVKIFHIF